MSETRTPVKTSPCARLNEAKALADRNGLTTELVQVTGSVEYLEHYSLAITYPQDSGIDRYYAFDVIVVSALRSTYRTKARAFGVRSTSYWSTFSTNLRTPSDVRRATFGMIDTLRRYQSRNTAKKQS